MGLIYFVFSYYFMTKVPFSSSEDQQRAVAKKVGSFMRYWGALQSLGAILFVIPFAVICSVLALVYIGGKDAVILTVFLLGIAAFVVILNSYGLKSSFQDGPQADQQNPFVGSTSVAVETKRLFPAATLQPNEKTLGWLGPVMAIDIGRQSYALGKEVIAAPENTLILTSHQLLVVALVQSDFDGLNTGSVLSGLAQFATAAKSASEQQRYVGILNQGQWPMFMESVAGDLSPLLSSHWQFGIAFENIVSVQARTGMLNPGIHITLKDRSILKYSTTVKGRIHDFVEALRGVGILIQ